MPVTQPFAPAAVPPWKFDLYVEAEADGEATEEQLAVLEADRLGWREALLRLLHEAEELVVAARSLPGEERNQVLADAQADHRRWSTAWDRFNGIERSDEAPEPVVEPDVERGERSERGGRRPQTAAAPGVVRLQVSWRPGHVVAWGAGPQTAAADAAAVTEMLAAAGAPAAPWVQHVPVPLPGGVAADAFAAPVGDVLGWLVAIGAGQAGADAGAGLRWLGRVAVWAVELTARGAMVPLLRQRRRRNGSDNRASSSFAVRWTPALIDARRLKEVADSLPGSVLALDSSVDAGP